MGIDHRVGFSAHPPSRLTTIILAQVSYNHGGSHAAEDRGHVGDGADSG